MRTAGPRIALMGFHLESNRFAPVVGRADAERRCLLTGPAILAEARAHPSRLPGTMDGFIHAMEASGPWTPVPVLLADLGAAGPIAHGDYEALRDEMMAGLRAALPVDGIFFSQHGAATTTRITDPDGEMFALARALVGPGIPVVATLDLHGNVSDRMVAATDLMIAYRTNPHVDQIERGAEAAAALRELLTGVHAETAFLRLPLMAPQVSQLTGQEPLAEVMAAAGAAANGRVMNVSILPGFTFGDTPDNGMAFLVATRGDLAHARRLCRELAERAWTIRQRFVPRLASIDDCVRRAVAVGQDPTLEPILIADVGDNPGGGARGNTTFLLEALHRAGAKRVVVGVFNDAALAAEAHRLGPGRHFTAVFNRAETTPSSHRFEAEAEIVHLSDGEIVGRPGATAAGRRVSLGPTATLSLGEVTVVVISERRQTLDSGFLESFGVDLGRARTVVVKSRGHFRAGFAHLFGPSQIVEADTPGLTAPNLAHVAFERIRRPMFPLDSDAQWRPPAW